MTAAAEPAGALQTLGIHRGTVVSFDDEVGLGVVEDAADGRLQYGFHCTQITDGTRHIAVDTAVTFTVVAGRRGAWEAAALTPTTPA